MRGLGALLLVGFLLFTAQASILSQRLLVEVRLPVLVAGIVLAAPVWISLVLAARARGAPWRWLGLAMAWGALGAAWLAFLGEGILTNIMVALAPRLTPDAGTGRLVLATVIAPAMEEPAKAAGVLIVLGGVRRAGGMVSIAMGAAIGALVGLWFALGEASNHVSRIVDDMAFIDRNGVFNVDWDAVRQIAELQLVLRLFFGGLTEHALFTALAGVAIVLLWQRRRRAAFAWFAAALVAHGLFNSVGVAIGRMVVDALVGRPGSGQPGIPILAVVWLSAVTSFVVAEGWAAIVLVRKLRRGDRQPA